MENEELRKLLQQLHEEIKNTQTVDEKGTELLTDLDRGYPCITGAIGR